RINAITCKLDTLIGALNTLVSNPNLASILSNVEQMSANLTTTTEHINTFMGRDLPVLASTYNKVGENVRVITENLKSVDIQNTLDSVNMTISNVNAIMQQVSNPNGTLGALMYDRSLYNSLNKTVSTVDSLMTDIKARPKRYVHFSLFGSKTK
ncbi:MAG: MCE family protein, partial [Bacteroidaceae bacterium]|nr:MCE family protein [Bacteroidaceae bacterium]